MELDVNFYKNIFDKELYWISLASKNLLNIYYINGKDGLREFYLECLNIINTVNNKPRLKVFIDMINDILNEIDQLTNDNNNGIEISINKLVSLFITNQLTK